MKHKKPNSHKPVLPKKSGGLPSKEALAAYIKESPTPVSKREIARAFNLHDDQRIELKRLLRSLKEEGTLEKARGRKLAAPDALPETAILEIIKADEDGDYLCRIVESGDEAKNAAITLHVSHHQGKLLRMEALTKGERVLARLERLDDTHYRARPIKRVNRSIARLVGVLERSAHGLILRPTDRKNKDTYILGPQQKISAEAGDVVVADVLNGGRLGTKQVSLSENLGPLDNPRVVSLIAIAQHGIPWDFPEAVVKAANALKPATLQDREDLRTLPLVTIDGSDARDFDDAVFAESDGKNGWHIVVAIADVSHYVTPGSVLDTEAYKRGNSVYFPDRVVPMLPEALSNELCSLKPKVDRACLVAYMQIDAHGHLQKFRFTRALMKSAARLTYEQAQKAADGAPDDTTAPLMECTIKPLYGAYETLLAARKKRGTLELDIAERVIKIGPDGGVAHIGPRDRLESHRLIEEFMILANVAAATALQDAGMAGLYRVHDVPGVEKLDSLRAFLKSFGISLPKGTHLKPGDLAQVLEKFIGTDHAPVISEVMLRSQAQAIYSPENIGHFGLALARYAHFTSPIRRYADLIVHRAIIRLFKLGDDGLTDSETERLDGIGEHISQTERRAIDAERSASDRYTSLYLSKKIGGEFTARISGVTRSGLFVRLVETGAEGFVPITTLPQDYYVHDEADHLLRGQRHHLTFRLADVVTVKLMEADDVLGSLRFAIAASHGKTHTPREPGTQRGPHRQQVRGHGRRGKKRR